MFMNINFQNTLHELDADGNGEIDFDEFLFYMTETERELDKYNKGNYKSIFINIKPLKGKQSRWPT